MTMPETLTSGHDKFMALIDSAWQMLGVKNGDKGKKETGDEETDDHSDTSN